jgi:hypothetical protein
MAVTRVEIHVEIRRSPEGMIFAGGIGMTLHAAPPGFYRDYAPPALDRRSGIYRPARNHFRSTGMAVTPVEIRRSPAGPLSIEDNFCGMTLRAAPPGLAERNDFVFYRH